MSLKLSLYITGNKRRDVNRFLDGFWWGCPGVPVHGGIPIVFISIHGVVTQFVNVSFLCVPVHEDTTFLVINEIKKIFLSLQGTRQKRPRYILLPNQFI